MTNSQFQTENGPKAGFLSVMVSDIAAFADGSQNQSLSLANGEAGPSNLASQAKWYQLPRFGLLSARKSRSALFSL